MRQDLSSFYMASGLPHQRSDPHPDDQQGEGAKGSSGRSRADGAVRPARGRARELVATGGRLHRCAGWLYDHICWRSRSGQLPCPDQEQVLCSRAGRSPQCPIKRQQDAKFLEDSQLCRWRLGRVQLRTQGSPSWTSRPAALRWPSETTTGSRWSSGLSERSPPVQWRKATPTTQLEGTSRTPVEMLLAMTAPSPARQPSSPALFAVMTGGSGASARGREPRHRLERSLSPRSRPQKWKARPRSPACTQMIRQIRMISNHRRGFQTSPHPLIRDRGKEVQEVNFCSEREAPGRAHFARAVFRARSASATRNGLRSREKKSVLEKPLFLARLCTLACCSMVRSVHASSSAVKF